MRSWLYRIYASDGVTFLAVWRDGSPPAFSVDANGVSDMTILLPRVYGLLDEPSEPGSSSSVAAQNVVYAILVDEDGDESQLYVGSLDELEIDLASGLTTVRVSYAQTVTAVSPSTHTLLVGVDVFGGRLIKTSLGSGTWTLMAQGLVVPEAVYPIETIQLGDTVQVRVPRVLPSAASLVGASDWNDTEMTITGLRFRVDAVELDLGQAPIAPGDLARKAAQQFSATQATVGAAGVASALPASPDKYASVFDPSGVEYVSPLFAKT